MTEALNAADRSLQDGGRPDVAFEANRAIMLIASTECRGLCRPES